MRKRTLVTEIMTTDVVSIKHDDDLIVAELLFKSNNIRHIPVVHGEDVVGILSYTDLMRISFVDGFNPEENEVDTVIYNMFTVEQIMVKNVVSVTPNSTIKEVAEILSEEEFHALLVLEGKKLKGIVTTTDLLKYLLKQY
jgi:CBS domain-containing protein